MNSEPIIVERTLNAPINKVWEAISDKETMKKWYFDFQEYKPEVGCEFYFVAGDDTRQFKHLCKLIELQEGCKISYSWRYEGYTGNSSVTFELFAEGEKTKLVLTHSGLESFPADAPELGRKNFEGGWDHIINVGLPGFVEKQ